MRRSVAIAVATAAMSLFAGAAQAWHIQGHVVCDANQDGQLTEGDKPLAGIRVQVVSTTMSFSGSDITDANGFYYIPLPDTPASFTVELDSSTLPAGASILSPTPVPYAFSVNDVQPSLTLNWLLSSAACEDGVCWLTGGGAKFSPITGSNVAERGPDHNFGGNVNPSCDPDPGDGGQWNHVAHDQKLHFLGTAIQVVRCGNVPGIPPGSTSPPTPFNFIEYQGTGTLKGIKGNKTNYSLVHFFARAEDRNEPGSSGAKDGAKVDRYFIHVYSDPNNPSGSTLLLIDEDSNPTTVDPVLITDGNLQIHISSCSNPPD